MNPYLQAKVDEYNGHKRVIDDLQTLVTREKRDFTDAELRTVSDRGEKAKALYTQIESDAEHELRSAKVQAMAGRIAGALAGAPQDGNVAGVPYEASGMYSLVPSAEDLAHMRAAIQEERKGRFTTARLPRDETERTHLRAAITMSLTGGDTKPINGSLPEPRRLATTVGLVPHASTTAGYSGPKFPAMSAAAATAEGSTKPEAAAPTALSIPIKQLARWNTLSRMALLSADGVLEQFVSYHSALVAKDEDKLIIDAVNTAAGAAVAFVAGDQRLQVRKAMAVVEDACNAPCDVVLCHTDDYALLAGFDVTSLDELGGKVVRFGGAALYPSSSVPTGFVLVAALAAAGWFIVADPPSVATVQALTTNEVTVRVEELVGFDVRLTGACRKVDVVTP